MRKEVSVSTLRCNPAQMRTRTRVGELAQLALQVSQGLDPALPLLVRRYAGQVGEVLEEVFVVLSGHRRWLARMVAALTPGGDLSQMVETIQTYCEPKNGWVLLTPKLYARLVELVGELTVPVEIWEGTNAEECLTLIRANMGPEEPDLLGLGHAFQEALSRDVPLEELARAAGMPAGMVQAIIEVDRLPGIFQSLINDGRLALETVPDLLKLDDVQLISLAWAVGIHSDPEHEEGAKTPPENYSSLIEHAISQLCFDPVPADRQHCRPTEHNTAHVIRAVWEQCIDETPAAFYREIAKRSLRQFRTDSGQTLMKVLAEMPAVQRYFTGGYYGCELKLNALDLMPDGAECHTCVFLCLPDQLLARDLDIPCRDSGKIRSLPEAGVCFHWTPEKAPFSVRTSYYWDQGAKEVKSKNALLKAWKRQQAHEQKEGTVPASSTTGKDDIKKQQEAIQLYMEHHAQPPFVVDHPWATPCARCRHHLDKSPVKAAPDRPHCQWAKGRRPLHFEAYVPSEGGYISPGTGKIIPSGSVALDEWDDFDPTRVDWMIPSCRQFAPIGEWAELIPEADTPPPYPRPVLLDLLRNLVASTNKNVWATDQRAALQWLSGRPEKASAKHTNTFDGAFKKAEEGLSNGQIWTLVQWVALEWLRTRTHTTMQYVPVGPSVVECSLMDFTTALNLMAEEEDE